MTLLRKSDAGEMKLRLEIKKKRNNAREKKLTLGRRN